jgi:competence/damage-inducible protein CinA-like protein
MQAEIFAIGTELLMGEHTDATSAWLTVRLPALGIELQRVSLLGDHLATLSDGISGALQGADLVVTIGGLGPPQADVTRAAIATALHETPTVPAETCTAIERSLPQHGRDLPAPCSTQAQRMPSLQLIPNLSGNAPGWWVETHGKIIVALPGAPAEMHPMWDEQVAPRLRQLTTGTVTLTRTMKLMGLSEAAVDERLAAYFGQANPYLGIYAKADGIHLRMIARARDVATAQALIQPVEAAIMRQLAPYVWGYDVETPEQAVGRHLVARGETLATMESGTGGYLATRITEVADSAGYYKGGIVASSPTMLLSHGVRPDVLQQYGTISRESALAMARAIRAQCNATFGIGVTGVPGPGEMEGKPAGLAYFAIASARTVHAQEMRVSPRRITLKRRVSNAAMIALSMLLRGDPGAHIEAHW